MIYEAYILDLMDIIPKVQEVEENFFLCLSILNTDFSWIFFWKVQRK